MATYVVTKEITVDAPDEYDADALVERILSIGFEAIEDETCDDCLMMGGYHDYEVEH